MSKTIEIQLDADTTNLSLKLKAIAKHAEALANELETINGKRNCPKCNSESYGVLYDGLTKIEICGYCDHLPTRLEGSD